MTVRVANGSPESILAELLSRLVSELGKDLVGHAKAIAHLEGGVIHASTTGAETGVDVLRTGSPTGGGDSFRMDFMCAFHGLSARRLDNAWEVAEQALVASGVSIVPLQADRGRSLAVAGALGPITATVMSSLFVLKPCCVLPALWAMSGSGLAFLQMLEPLEAYRVHFVVLSLFCLAAGFHRLYLSPGVRKGSLILVSIRRARTVLWFSALIFVVALLAPRLVTPTQSQERPSVHLNLNHDHH